jgi:hypothetical protein
MNVAQKACKRCSCTWDLPIWPSFPGVTLQRFLPCW